MLTPVEIQNRAFKSGGLGYDKKDVDAQYIKNNAQSETTKERDVWINNIENKYNMIEDSDATGN